ncbi:alpha/beta fold hydrolase [Caldovatus aquaticus]|uniref:Alpha/beta hydrolase n=1 Tax=Caldovatus aquaticus TaxID=2865671 RepID=A0ABS7F2P9_9PROT|nr:alpha/beta hydrolase [Caldovatus aquaticus]MBW8269272.1 alpha/beta hydrolase [Caldovatus aquaticus]
MTPATIAVRTATLEIACEVRGPETGPAVILLHGFPDDVRAWDGVAAPLAGAGCRVVVPYLRGCGATRFLDPGTPRSGEQAALGHDLRALMDALRLPRALLAGYDWGGRAACVVAALWPERVAGLVTGNGYAIQDIAAAARPAAPAQELRFWYQWYFHTERGRAGLAANRRALCRLLWELWSPTWRFAEAEFERTAPSFDNPDFVAVAIHSYRHRYGAAPGDPALAPIEAQLARQPRIAVPTICLHGADDGVAPPETSAGHARHFAGPYARRVLPGVGHFLPREAPEAHVRAVLELLAR